MGNCMAASSRRCSVQKQTANTIHDGEDSSSIEAPEPFVYSKKTCALEYWEPIKLLGEGSVSSVHLVRRRKERVNIPYKEHVDVMARAKKKVEQVSHEWPANDQLYAVKSISKEYIRDDKMLKQMKDEIFTMSTLSHPNIVRVIEGYERKRHVYLIMDCCRGGDLCQVEGTSEQHAKAIVRRILSAVAYLHEKGIVHRDLKLENVMFETTSRKASEIKLIDFGLATKYFSSDGGKLTDIVGTVYTMAPEVMKGIYDSKCDMWALGVVCYVLLSGTKPFWGPLIDIPQTERRAIMIDRILRADYVDMKGGSWDNVSDDAKSFIESLLRLDPLERPSAQEALASKWLCCVDDIDEYVPSGDLTEQAPPKF